MSANTVLLNKGQRPQNRKLAARLINLKTLLLAKRLLGMRITTKAGGKMTSGIIVETEAYDARVDQACHGYYGKTRRNFMMFESAGHWYVYKIYGIHHCVNLVSEPAGIAAAVLIRAIEPVAGIETMLKRRGIKIGRKRKVNQENSEEKNKRISPPFNLTNGPGKLCQALGIDKTLSGEHTLTSDKIWLEKGIKFKLSQIATSTRIGITKAVDLKWRFFIKNNPWVSK
ncbi:MAG TPA: DNA-3-methyladenine glycosylase [Oligoflexia bacterium]|nr:DNA-3-methyladenine glycosylase [Oligoflexia bacterium]HMP27886.1 DNA-3-methyladenine glycosylase [Oligoflexia bacterium]